MKVFLADRYPAPPDGSAEIERERMSREDVRYAAAKLKDEATEAFSRAYALESWWRAKQRVARAKKGMISPLST
jgi:hypothetical protein